MFDKNTYVGPPESWNIWQIQNTRWELLVDDSGHPLEFVTTGPDFKESGSSKAYEFIHDAVIKWPEYDGKSFKPSHDGVVRHRKAPSNVHSVGTFNLSEQEINEFFVRFNCYPIESEFPFRKYLSGFPPEQLEIYMGMYLRVDKKNKEMMNMLCYCGRELFCSGSYWSNKVILDFLLHHQK